jgi:hypothetical protein
VYAGIGGILDFSTLQLRHTIDNDCVVEPAALQLDTYKPSTATYTVNCPRTSSLVRQSQSISVRSDRRPNHLGHHSIRGACFHCLLSAGRAMDLCVLAAWQSRHSISGRHVRNDRRPPTLLTDCGLTPLVERVS